MIVLSAWLVAGAFAQSAERCTYDTYRWNVPRREAVRRERVDKPYAEVTEEERDPGTGCTVCEQDQVVVELPGVTPFRVCRLLAPALSDTLRRLLADGHVISTVEGYRPGRSRGEVDADGNRTQFSNHAFGTAIDVNRSRNGLYGDCIAIGPDCRLLQGGVWTPGTPGTLTADGPVVTALASIGLQWGGTISGRQKDFMHFSPSGY